MLQNQYSEYIQIGLLPGPRKQIRKVALGPLLITPLGIWPCIILGGIWFIPMSLVLLFSVALTVAIFIISFQQFTIRNRLIMQALLYSNFVFQFLMIGTVCYLLTYGFNFWILLLYIPPLTTPVILGCCNARNLRLNRMRYHRGGLWVAFPFGAVGIVGFMMAKVVLQRATQNVAIIIALIVVVFVSSMLSIGLLAYQKLYYIKNITFPYEMDIFPAAPSGAAVFHSLSSIKAKFVNKTKSFIFAIDKAYFACYNKTVSFTSKEYHDENYESRKSRKACRFYRPVRKR
ncbi:MAG: hypothetical protein IKB75_06570 [Clostridia bacterium]|nr:hypothetical protein [Clostridia bacterium]